MLFLIDIFINKDPIENMHTRTTHTHTLLYSFTSFNFKRLEKDTHTHFKEDKCKLKTLLFADVYQ